MLGHYLITALRSFYKRKGGTGAGVMFTYINVFGLAIGLAALPMPPFRRQKRSASAKFWAPVCGIFLCFSPSSFLYPYFSLALPQFPSRNMPFNSGWKDSPIATISAGGSISFHWARQFAGIDGDCQAIIESGVSQPGGGIKGGLDILKLQCTRL